MFILDPFDGMRYLEVLKQHSQLVHSNLKLFNIFVLNVTHKFSILNRTVFSFLSIVFSLVLFCVCVWTPPPPPICFSLLSFFISVAVALFLYVIIDAVFVYILLS